MNQFHKYIWLGAAIFFAFGMLLPSQSRADTVSNSACSATEATLTSLQQVADFGYSSVCWYFCPGICSGSRCYMPQSSSFNSCTDLCQTISGVVSTGGGTYCGPGYAVTCLNPTNCHEEPGSSAGWCKQVCDCSGSVIQGTNSSPSGYCDAGSQCNCQLNSLGGMCQMNYSGSFSATVSTEYICGGGGGGAPAVDLKVNGADAPAGSPLAVPRKDSSAITLSWTVSNATSCTATKSASAPGAWSGGKSTTSGSESQSPVNVPGSHSYTLSCSNSSGTTTDTVYIAVPNCNTQSFISGSVSPSSVSPNGTYTAACNYGVVTNTVFFTAGSGSCSFVNFSGTTANFSCTAGATPGTYANTCSLGAVLIAPDYYCSSSNSVNSLTVIGPAGTVQGWKVKMPGNLTNDATINGQTVTIDGANAQTSNPYIYNGVSAGSHTVAVSVPSGFTAGYTLCYNSTTCHSNAPTAGSSVVVNVPSGGYADLWWHFTPNNPPIANATISKDGITYANVITVTQGVATPIYLAASSAAGVSSDPDGWAHATFGMSGGTAKCDWNRDLNQGAAVYEAPVNTPATAAACNISLGNLTFNDVPGTYTYNVLRLTDRAGGVSNVDTVQVQVSAPATGAINVRYTIDGAAQSANQTINYSIAGPTPVLSGSYTVNGASSHTLRNAGSYTFTYNSGAPSGKTFSSITPSATQTLSGGGSITYTVNFITVISSPGTGASHLACVSQSCQFVAGSGADTCASNAACGGSGSGTIPGPVSGSVGSATSTTACGKITLKWQPGANATSYNIYRDTHLGAPVILASNIGNVLTYTDSTAVAGTFYDYWVESVGNSTKVAANTNATGGLSPISCSNGNLTTSDKDITAVNGNSVASASACNSSTNALPASTTLRLGDILTFNINLCNNNAQSTGPASNLSVVDTLVNLIKPTAGWNMKYYPPAAGVINLTEVAGSPGPNQFQVTGAVPNQTLTINLTGQSITNGTFGYLSFNAQLAVPSGFAGQTARFQNGFTVNYNKAPAAPAAPVSSFSPLLLFSTGSKAPVIIEIP